MSYLILKKKKIIGFIIFKKIKLICAIRFFVIKKKYQSKGLGKKLFRFSLNDLKRKDIKSIHISTGQKEEEANQFYKNLKNIKFIGFKKKLFRISLQYILYLKK